MWRIAKIHTTDIPSEFVPQIQTIDSVVAGTAYQLFLPKNFQILLNHKKQIRLMLFLKLRRFQFMYRLLTSLLEYDLSMVTNLDRNPLAIHDKYFVNFVDSFHSNWIISLYESF